MIWVPVRVDPWLESTCDTNRDNTATNHNRSHCSANQGLPPGWPLTSDPEQSTGPCQTAVCSAFKPRPSFCFPSFVSIGQGNRLGFLFQSTLRRSPSFPSQLWPYPQCLLSNHSPQPSSAGSPSLVPKIVLRCCCSGSTAEPSQCWIQFVFPRASRFQCAFRVSSRLPPLGAFSVPR